MRTIQSSYEKFENLNLETNMMIFTLIELITT